MGSSCDAMALMGGFIAYFVEGADSFLFLAPRPRPGGCVLSLFSEVIMVHSATFAPHERDETR